MLYPGVRTFVENCLVGILFLFEYTRTSLFRRSFCLTPLVFHWWYVFQNGLEPYTVGLLIVSLQLVAAIKKKATKEKKENNIIDTKHPSDIASILFVP